MSEGDELIPAQFRKEGMFWWWGVVQLYLFRLQPQIESLILHESSQMNGHRGFPFGSLIAGLHVRHGDKTIDGWRLHSFENELAAVRKSPDCNFGSHSLLPTASSSEGDDTRAGRRLQLVAADRSPLAPRGRRYLTSLRPGVCQGGNASSSADNDNNLRGGVAEQSGLYVFVASDDPNVLSTAHHLGHLVDSTGVSQKTGSTGMVNVLSKHPEYGFNASVEILSDIYFLSRCSTLVGTAASQIFRLAVALSHANATLHYPIALDYGQLTRIKHMSAKYELIVPEEFQAP